jgi:hypothetical protein
MHDPQVMTSSAAEADIAYRPLNVASLIVLILGTLSVTTLFKLSLLVFPCLTLVVGAWALWQLTHDPKEPLGWHAAIIGIGLAIFFAVSAVTFEVARRDYLNRTAESLGREWLELLQENRVEEAHHLRLDGKLRISAPDELPRFYSTAFSVGDPSGDLPFKPSDQLARFSQIEPIRSILANPQAQIEIVGRKHFFEDRDILVFNCRASRPDTAQDDLEFDLTMERRDWGFPTGIVWTVFDCKVKTPASALPPEARRIR